MIIRQIQQVSAVVLGALMCTQALAGSISASYEGADVSVIYNIDGSNSQLVSFEYLFSVGDPGEAANWLGTTMDAFSVQFGAAGNNSNTIIESISATSTNSANINGEWMGLLGKVTGNGCQDNDSETVCYTRDPTGEAGSPEETVIAANTDYSFYFDVLFFGSVDVPGILAGNHSIKFLSLKQNKSGQWTTGLQLSESGPLFPGQPPGGGPGPNPMPAPGILYLFGLALCGMHLVRRRRY